MKIGVLSDTHLHHDKITVEPCDLLLHCGDATNVDSCFDINIPLDKVIEEAKIEFIEFLQWYSSLPAKEKIFTPGNHDIFCEKREPEARELCQQYGVILLINESYISNNVKIFGSPNSNMVFNRFAFSSFDDKEDLGKIYGEIPEDVDILVTHQPPYGLMDEIIRKFKVKDNVGSRELKRRLESLNDLKYHFFGHVHQGQGIYWNTQYYSVNAAKRKRPYYCEIDK